MPSFDMGGASQGVGARLTLASGRVRAYRTDATNKIRPFVSGFAVLAQRTGKADMFDDDVAEGTTTMLGTFMSLITTLIGAGVLSFPATFAKGGWIASIATLMGCSWIMTETSFIMVECLEMIEARIAKGEDFGFARPVKFDDFCFAAFGNAGKRVIFAIVNSYMLFLCGAFMILIGDTTVFVIGASGDLAARNICVLSTLVIFVPFTLLDDISFIVKLSSVGVFASVIYIVAIFSAGLQAGSDMSTDLKFFRNWPESVTDFGVVLSIMLLALNFHSVAPSLRAEMKEPKEFNRSAVGAVIVVASIYCLAGSMGYYGWGSSVNGNVTLSMSNADGTPSWAGYSLSIAVIANLLVSFPIFMSCVARAVEVEFVGHYSAPTRMGVLAIALAVGLFVPYFFEFFGLLASLLSCPLVTVVPVACFWALAKHDGLENQKGLGLKYVKHTIFCIVGLVAMVMGTIGAVGDLITAFNAE